MKERIDFVKAALAGLYEQYGPELCGFIHNNDQVVKVPNVAADPENGFLMSTAAVIENTDNDQSWASWHTHPNASSNLSGEDHSTFMRWKDMVHFIIGNDGVRAYQYSEKVKTVIEL